MLTVLVTGATGGIGLETAIVLARMGHSVIIHGRDARKGESLPLTSRQIMAPLE